MPIEGHLLIVDIDGTVRRGRDDFAPPRWVNGPADVEVFDEARAALAEWRALGGYILGVSNQGGIGTGDVEADAVHAAMVETVHQLGHAAAPDLILWCPHHPQDDCACRKPKIGMVTAGRAALGWAGPGERTDPILFPPWNTWVVGDRAEDRGLASGLGAAFLDAREWRTHIREGRTPRWPAALREAKGQLKIDMSYPHMLGVRGLPRQPIPPAPPPAPGHWWVWSNHDEGRRDQPACVQADNPQDAAQAFALMDWSVGTHGIVYAVRPGSGAVQHFAAARTPQGVTWL